MKRTTPLRYTQAGYGRSQEVVALPAIFDPRTANFYLAAAGVMIASTAAWLSWHYLPITVFVMCIAFLTLRKTAWKAARRYYAWALYAGLSAQFAAYLTMVIV